tara:strand:- start:361 stop:549 length:189 start_codon:yes stop_codon:yes gene_type:complete
MIPAALIKLIVPKVLDMVIKQFKMDKVMDYVFQENELDDKVKDLQDEIDYLKARIINLEKEK